MNCHSKPHDGQIIDCWLVDIAILRISCSELYHGCYGVWYDAGKDKNEVRR